MKPNISTFIFFLLVPIFLSGVLACQEEPNTSEVSATRSPVTHEPKVAPNSTSTSSGRTSTPSLRKGKVVSLSHKDQIYTIKTATGEVFSVKPSDSILVDESLGLGDLAEVRYDEENHPIALRKVRGAASPNATGGS